MNLLDRAINYFSPESGFRRLQHRKAHETLEKYTPKQEAPRKAGSGPQAGYNQAYPTRYSTPWGQSESLSGLPHLNWPVHRNLRDRARSLCENNPLASSMMRLAVDNIIGPLGFQLQILSKNEAWAEKAEGLMNGWFNSADYNGRSWVQHQRLLATSLLRDGDVGGALLKSGQVQLVEGDYISNWNKPDAFLHDGIEVDSSGLIKNFWVMTFVDLKKRDWKAVKPKDMLFIARTVRNTQYRGETVFAQSFDLFDQFSDVTLASTMAWKIACCFAALAKMKTPQAAIQGLSAVKNADGKEQKRLLIEPGTIQMLQAGVESIEQMRPEQPGPNFPGNAKMLLRLLGLSLGMPLEYVLMDFSEVSGQTAKASALMAQRSFETVQRQIIDDYLTRLYQWRISKFVKEGLLEAQDDAWAHRWHAEPWPYLDPVKELQAKKLAIDMNLSSETRENMLLGQKIDQVKAERVSETAFNRKNDLPIYHGTNVQEIGVKAPASTEESDAAPDKIPNKAVQRQEDRNAA